METNQIEEKKLKKQLYYEGIGRRKQAVARVRLRNDLKEIIVNDLDYQKYFSTELMKETAISPLKKMKVGDRFGVTILIKGGGLTSQAEAVRLGLSRALIKFNADYKNRLSRLSYLKRDPRVKERKKYGLKKARRAPQWSKR